jgi:hypothetical protein
MTSFAQVKRSIEVGTLVAMTHWGDYGPGDTLRWGDGTLTLPATRRVAIVQGNAIAFDIEGRTDKSWLYWPKAADVTIHDDRTFSIGGDRRAMTYVIEARTDERGVVEVFDANAYRTAHPESDVTTCGACERSWDDAVITAWTPTPSARCPFEYDHKIEEA